MEIYIPLLTELQLLNLTVATNIPLLTELSGATKRIVQTYEDTNS